MRWLKALGFVGFTLHSAWAALYLPGREDAWKTPLPSALQVRVNDAVSKGHAWLERWAKENAGDPRIPAWMKIDASYALLLTGSRPGDATVWNLCPAEKDWASWPDGWSESVGLIEVYAQACRMLSGKTGLSADERGLEKNCRRSLEKLVKKVVAGQMRELNPHGHSMILDALDSAACAGVHIPREVWERGVDYLAGIVWMEGGGSWGAGAFPRIEAFAGLWIGARHLGANHPVRKRAEIAIARYRKWLKEGDNVRKAHALEGNDVFALRSDAWPFLGGVDPDWYAKECASCVERQAENGNWPLPAKWADRGSDDDASPRCVAALIFLASKDGYKTGPAGNLYAVEESPGQ